MVTKLMNRLSAMFDNLESYMQPSIDGKARVKKELHFINVGRKTSVKDGIKHKTTGNDSKVRCENTTLNSFDGDGLDRLYIDEAGKVVEMNISSYLEVARRSVVTKSGFGKIVMTTTVNKEDAGGKNFKVVWIDSDYHDERRKENNNQTISGLYKYFIPAYEGLDDGS